MIDKKDTVSKEGIKEVGPRVDLRVVSDRVSESFCTVLKKTREKKGLTLREIADALHVSLSTIVALEEQRFDILPADIYTVGYIRSYAALLDLNPEGLVKDFKQAKELLELNARDRILREQQNLRESLKKEESEFEKLTHKLWDKFNNLKQNFGTSILVLAVLVLLTVGFLFQSVDKTKIESIKHLDKVKVQKADGSVLVKDLMDVESATPVISGKSESVVADNRVKIMFSDTTWITVRDKQQNLIHQSREQKGAVLEVTGEAPFYLKLSKASAANLYFNEQLVDFSAQVSDDDQLHEFVLNP